MRPLSAEIVGAIDAELAKPYEHLRGGFASRIRRMVGLLQRARAEIPSSPTLDIIDVHRMLRAHIARVGSVSAVAKELGVAPTFVSSVLHSKRPVTDAMLDMIGVRRMPEAFTIKKEA